MLPWRAVLGPGLALLLLGAGLAQGEEPVIYRWVDQNGIAHYTTDPERIPSSLRGSIRRLSAAAEAEPAGATERATPRDAPAATWAERDAVPEAEAPEPAVPGADLPAVSAGTHAAEAAGAEVPAEPAGLDEEIAALEAEIARDEERLKSLISDPARAGEAGLADDPEFREVARRLPRLQADLRALRAERERLAEPESPQP